MKSDYIIRSWKLPCLKAGHTLFIMMRFETRVLALKSRCYIGLQGLLRSRAGERRGSFLPTTYLN